MRMIWKEEVAWIGRASFPISSFVSVSELFQGFLSILSIYM